MDVRSSPDARPAADVAIPDAAAPDVAIPDAANSEQGTPCRWPPLSLCEPPGSRATCPNHWYCPGCNCTRSEKAAACNALTQDCRWFCSGCYPAEYVSCSDPLAPPDVLGLCAYCFMVDGGVAVRPECDRLDALLDAGP